VNERCVVLQPEVAAQVVDDLDDDVARSQIEQIEPRREAGVDLGLVS
jgi:hypothetical protein